MDTDKEQLYFACDINACPKCGSRKIWISFSRSIKEKFGNKNIVQVDCKNCCGTYYVQLYEKLNIIINMENE